jgi:hypothetical protein
VINASRRIPHRRDVGACCALGFIWKLSCLDALLVLCTVSTIKLGKTALPRADRKINNR